MLGQGWLPLNDYSNKYNISISTLRRRIRSGAIDNQFRDGKYWLRDQPTNRAYQTDRADLASVSSTPAQIAMNIPGMPSQSTPVISSPFAPPPAPTLPRTSQLAVTADDSRALEMANQLVAELKSAYVLILQEKEEQILLLKEEAADLKTLVRILESENQKLKGTDISEPHGEWLNDGLS